MSRNRKVTVHKRPGTPKAVQAKTLNEKQGRAAASNLFRDVVDAMAIGLKLPRNQVLASLHANAEAYATLEAGPHQVRLVQAGALTTEVLAASITATNPTQAWQFHTSDIGYFVDSIEVMVDGDGENSVAGALVSIAGIAEDPVRQILSEGKNVIPWGRICTASQIFSFTSIRADDTAPVGITLIAQGGRSPDFGGEDDDDYVPGPEVLESVSRGPRTSGLAGRGNAAGLAGLQRFTR